MRRRLRMMLGAVVASAVAATGSAWEHPSHMVTAASAFEEVERMRPEAPEVPANHWAELQERAHSQVNLAGYRIAHDIVGAADSLVLEQSMTGRILQAVD